MGDNVISMTIVPTALDRNEDLCKALRELLVEAESGEIMSMAWASYRRGDMISNGWEGAPGTQFQLSSSISILQTRYTMHVMGTGD